MNENEYAYTALMLAAQNGHLGVVEELIAASATVNHVDQAGETALMLAAQNGHTEIKKVLKKFLSVKNWISTKEKDLYKEINDSLKNINDSNGLEQESRIIDWLEAFQTKIEKKVRN